MPDNFAAQFFQHVDASVPQYVAELGEVVAIPSVSADLQNHLKDIIKLEEWTKAYVEKLGGTAELLPNPKVRDDDGNELPPILLAEFKATENSDSKKTVCCYAHLGSYLVISDIWRCGELKPNEKSTASMQSEILL
jgi:acetylornithine deacetylase/succinyl-diaminopimelate desuccinylase-like protein